MQPRKSHAQTVLFRRSHTVQSGRLSEHEMLSLASLVLTLAVLFSLP